MVSAALLMFGLFGMLGTVGWILRRGNNNRMTRLFLVCLLSIALWLVSQLLILFSVSDTQLSVSYLIGNAGICAFSPFWLMFSAEYSETSQKLKRLTAFLPSIAVLMFGCIAANPLHGLYYAKFGKSGIEYGCLFYVFQLLFYVFIISGISLMFVRHSKRSSIVSNQSLLLALAASVPLIINIFTVSGVIKSKIELTPLFFAFSVIMVLIAIQRYGLLNINRMAIRDIIDNIDIAAIIFDADGNVTYKNKSAKSVIPADFTDHSGFIAELSRISGNAADFDSDSAELVVGEERYSLKKSRICNEKGTEIARIVLISNVSEFYELTEAEKKLSLEHERNRIAQEIHDSAGHTFTMISSIAKIMQAELQSKNADSAELLNYASEIDGLSRSGITQLRCSINNLRDDEFMTSVTRAVNTVTAAVRSMKTEICVQGTEDSRFSFCIREIYDTVKETVTNSMRYSGADRLDIIIKFLDDRLELYIFDNGRGCAEIKENNGLRGIRERIEKIGGTVRFSSIEGEGFTTIVKVHGRSGNDKSYNSR
ncbi:MAG: two-component sensor histidine kinase [Ruminococcus sp.]|nr:two-component sensor histidine kinase [Ruminococcus sp.]MBO5164937.1 two-component sensor histidine kinase [Ruminococcus sp.]